ncbi:MAG: type IV toxin-antitoxin system AbiEi family antitoxin domain-containing protein [Solirubrobacteraceae bacterium]
MNTLAAYQQLRQVGVPVIETCEAATLLGVSSDAVTKHLRQLRDSGLIVPLRKGLWLLDPAAPKAVIAPYLTAPYAAYVSLWSALAHHGMIEQIPARTEIASLSRTRTMSTPVGVFAVHRLAPEVFGGYVSDDQTGYVATPEKALFDVVYTRAPRASRIRLPELTLSDTFDTDSLWGWVRKIPRARLRTIVTTGLNAALSQAAQLAASD